MSDTPSVLFYAYVFLLGALLVVPVTKRLGLGPVLGYFLAGILIGPWGLAVIREPEPIALFEEFTTLVLLFMLAMQATPRRMSALIDGRFSLGFTHLLYSFTVIFIIALLTGLTWPEALVCGLALSLSSGAVARHAFTAHYPAGSPLTETGERLLLSQSLLILPLLLVVPLLGFDAAATEGSRWPMVLRSAFAVLVIGVAGPVVLRHALRFAVSIGLDEVFTALALLIVIGLLLLMQLLGIPVEIGAVLAGYLLVRSDYGNAISVATRPFLGLMVGWFFMAVGMTIDFATLFRKPADTLALVVLLVVVKAWALRTLLRWSAVPRRQRIWLATVLSQGGELAFVIIHFAGRWDVIPIELDGQLMLIVALSMFTTPLLLHWAAKRDVIPPAQQTNTGVEHGLRADSQVIIAGYGRVGQVVAQLLHKHGFRVAIIESNPDQFHALREAGFIGFYGDALRPDLLEAAGADRAVVMVIAIDDTERALELCTIVRHRFVNLTVLARGANSAVVDQFIESGADRAYSETFETALLIGEDVLEGVGVSPLDAQAYTEVFRDAVAMNSEKSS